MIEKAEDVPGWLTVAEGMELQKLATDKLALEVGSYLGKSTYYMAETAQKIVCVDTFRANHDGQHQNEKYTTLFEFLGNTYKYRDRIIPIVATSLEAAAIVPNDHFDVVFIDAMHTYEDVSNDIKAWYPKVKVGGHIAFHDYHPHWPGVIQAIEEHFGKPKRLVDSLVVVQKKGEI